MNVGIVVEYNPFHNGHKLQIKKIKAEDSRQNCIVVMSGNFVQRGEPALFDKWVRTEMALLNGADMVLELPIFYATAGADLFAYGAVCVLEKTGIIDKLCFGTETGDITALDKIADVLVHESEAFSYTLKKELSTGVSFPKARMHALSHLLQQDLHELEQPNTILALEYMIALKKIGSKIEPFTIKREGASYHSKELGGTIASATAIRHAVSQGNIADALCAIPDNCRPLFLKSLASVHTLDDYSSVLHYILRTKSKDDIASICDISEGLENRILLNANGCMISELIGKIKTRRYTYTRLQRALIHVILDMTKSDLKAYRPPFGPRYIRVLGFRKEKEYILKDLVKKAKVPVLINLKESRKPTSKFAEDRGAMNSLAKEIMSTDIYFLNEAAQCEFRKPPIII